MPTWAFWTHGNTAIVERPEYITANKLSKGLKLVGLPSRVNKPEWIHYAIPSPVTVGTKMYLGRVMLRGNTSGAEAIIQAVRVFDSDRRVVNKEEINLSGSFMQDRRFLTIQELKPRDRFRFGISLSLLVRFLDVSPDREIFISSVGIDVYDSK